MKIDFWGEHKGPMIYTLFPIDETQLISTSTKIFTRGRRAGGCQGGESLRDFQIAHTHSSPIKKILWGRNHICKVCRELGESGVHGSIAHFYILLVFFKSKADHYTQTVKKKKESTRDP